MDITSISPIMAVFQGYQDLARVTKPILNRQGRVRTTIALSLTIAIAGCNTNTDSRDQDSNQTAGTTFTTIADIDFRTTTDHNFILNEAQVEALFLNETPRLWQFDQSGTPGIYLLPPGLNESYDQKSDLMSYSEFVISGVSDYDWLSLDVSADFTQISDDYPSAPTNCDLLIQSQTLLDTSTIFDREKTCFEDRDYFSFASNTYGVDELTLTNSINFSAVYRGILGYQDSHLPVTRYRVYGAQFENSSTSGAYELHDSQFYIDEQCILPEPDGGHFDIDSNGTYGEGSLTIDKLTVNIEASTEQNRLYSMAASLFDGAKFLGEATVTLQDQMLHLEFAEGGLCNGTLVFERTRSDKGKRSTEVLLYSSDQTDNLIQDPLVRLAKPDYPTPAHEALSGINFLIDGYQSGTTGYIANLVSPVYQRNGSDRLRVSLDWQYPSALSFSNIGFSTFVNYGFGWVPFKSQPKALGDQTNLTFDILYSNQSDSVQFAVALNGYLPTIGDSDAFVYLTNAKIDNVDITVLEEYQQGILDVRALNGLIGLEECDSPLHYFNYQLDFDNSRLILKNTEVGITTWNWDKNMNVSGEYSLDGRHYTFSENLNSERGTVTSGNCTALFFNKFDD